MDLETFEKLIKLMLRVHWWTSRGILEFLPKWMHPAMQETLDLADELYQWAVDHGLNEETDV
jgi:hypothetical protein